MKVLTDSAELIDFGTTAEKPTIGITDYSRRVTDDFGVTTVVERGFARRMSVRIGIPTTDVDVMQRNFAALRATPATWIADERFTSLQVRGFYKDFSIDLAVGALSFCTLTVEGFLATETFDDPGGDPAPAGNMSTLRLLQPLDVTPAILTTSNVVETDYPAWSAGMTYSAGARVIKEATHRVYESVTAANTGNDPAGTSGVWLEVGPTNRWAMFDLTLGTSTSAASPITVTLAPGAIINGVALLDVLATSVRVQTTGYDRTITLDHQPAPVAFLDLPASSNPVTVTITNTGTASVGTLLMGRIRDLGATEESPSVGITDYSRKDTDDFGEVTVTPRGWAKRAALNSLIRTDAIDIVAGRVEAVRARPALWIGQEGQESLTLFGFFKDFSIEVGEIVSKLALSIEGLSEADKVLPLTVPPQAAISRAVAPPFPGYNGMGWVDPASGHFYVNQGLGLTFAGVTVTIAGKSIDMPWVLSRDAAATNFDARNDRLSAAIVAPLVVADGSAVDHVQNTDGSVDMSFEWVWHGAEAEIDGFEVIVYSDASAATYTVGTNLAAEQRLTVAAGVRSFILRGVPADRYYTFGVRAYRVVDSDIAAAQIIRSTITQPSEFGENPYRPSASVAFAGDITGTIEGRAATAVLASLDEAAADVAQAITDAAAAQGTADGKVTTFYQTSAPTAEGEGDLWIDTDDSNRLYRWSGSSWVTIADARISTAISNAATAQATADGKITTFYQTSAPTAEGEGDLWVDTDDGNKLYRWNGVAWVAVRDAGATRALAGLNSDGTVATGKVTATSLSADVLNRIVSATATGVTATDSGVVLLTLSGVDSKPSQGGFVHLILTCSLKLTVSTSTTSCTLYGRLQRSPAGSGTWTELYSWRMGSLTNSSYSVLDDGTKAYLDGYTLRMGVAAQKVDIPPTDASYDYRWIASKTPAGTGSTAPEVGAGVVDTAEGLALSVKVAS